MKLSIDTFHRLYGPTLVVNNDNPEPLNLTLMVPHDPMARLSSEQRLTVRHTLREWRNEFARGRVKINTTRRQIGAIPSWADWSGCAWVQRNASVYRSEMFARLTRWHITTLMHLALPPFWLDDDDIEKDCKARYGHWTDELNWIPPNVIKGTTVWLPR